MTSSDRAGSLSKPPSSFVSLAIERWWTRIPVRLARYSSLLSVAWSDGTYLASRPRLAIALPLLALALGVVEGVGHFKFLAIWDIGISFAPAAVFAQSLPLVVAAALLGTLSANAGLMLLLGYALGDFVLAGAPWLYRDNTFLPTLIHVRVPQLFTYVLFFMLAVMPVLCTNHLLAGLYRRMAGKDLAARAIRIGAMAVVQGLFLYEWTLIAPLAIHALWAWEGSGSPITVAYFQRVAGPWVVGAGVAAVVLRGWLTETARSDAASAARIERLDAVVEQAVEGPGFVQRRPWLQALLAAALMTALAAGFMPSPLMATGIFCLVVAVLLVRAYLLPKLFARSGWTGLVGKVPEGIRLLAAVLGTYGLTVLIAGRGSPNPIAGQFGVELAGLGLGLLLLMVLLPGDPPEGYQTAAAPAGLRLGTVGKIGLGIAFFFLVAKRSAYAQCNDPWCCCSGSNQWCALAASGYIPSFGGLLGTAPRRRKKGKAPAQPDPCAAQRQAVTDARERAAMYYQQRQTYENEMEADAKQTGADDAVANQALAALKEALSWNAGAWVLRHLDGLPADASDMTSEQMQALTRQFGSGPAAARVAALAQAFSQLQQDMTNFENAKARWNRANDDYNQAMTDLENADKALQDCLKSHSSGDGGGAAPA